MVPDWQKPETLNPKIYRCGHCGREISSQLGFRSQSSNFMIYICHTCGHPTYFDNPHQAQFPGVPFGGDVEFVPPESAAIYREARNCMTVSAYTAVVLLCRKLLMHIAVDEGAAAGESFASYVTHLINIGAVPPRARAWVDRIRQKGNVANHEIAPTPRADAEELITLCEMVLKLMYEFPGRVAPPTP